MTQQAFERNIEELIITVEDCLKGRRILPGLLLVYAGIDIMAWLNRPECHEDVKSDDFIEWADKYLLPGAGFACSASDLYAARCGLIHSYIAESRRSRRGQAKMIFYAWGTACAEDLQTAISHSNIPPAVAVRVENLFDAFCTGVERFKQSLTDDPKRANLVYQRAGKFFSPIDQQFPFWLLT
jgi:hypothetical protein